MDIYVIRHGQQSTTQYARLFLINIYSAITESNHKALNTENNEIAFTLNHYLNNLSCSLTLMYIIFSLIGLPSKMHCTIFP